MRNHRAEGARRIETALHADQRPSAARAWALNGAAVLAVESGDGVTAKLHAEEALAINESLGDAWGIAFSIFMVGGGAGEQGDHAQARDLLEEAVRRFQELGDEKYAERERKIVGALPAPTVGTTGTTIPPVPPGTTIEKVRGIENPETTTSP